MEPQKQKHRAQKRMKVLLSAPRAGSSWYYESILEHNLTVGAKELKPAEYLNPIFGPTLDEKIKFLNISENQWSFKHHINYLKTDTDWYTNWFVNFYANDEVIVLRRDNVWKWFKSFLVQDLLSWKFAGVSEVNTTRIMNSVNEYSYERSLEQFFAIKRQLDSVAYDTLVIYENLPKRESKYTKLSTQLDYDYVIAQRYDVNTVYKRFKEYDV